MSQKFKIGDIISIVDALGGHYVFEIVPYDPNQKGLPESEDEKPEDFYGITIIRGEGRYTRAYKLDLDEMEAQLLDPAMARILYEV